MELAFRLLGLGQASRYDTPRIYSCFTHGNEFNAFAACIPGVGVVVLPCLERQGQPTTGVP